MNLRILSARSSRRASFPISPTWRGSKPRAPAPITPPTQRRSAPAELAALDAGAVAGLRIDLHPSLEIVRSDHPIVTIWAMNSGAQKLAPIETWSAEDALIVRPYLDVEVRLLPPGGAVFLRALAEGRSLGSAADAALADHPDFDLTGNLAGLIGWGLVRGVILAQPNERAPS